MMMTLGAAAIGGTLLTSVLAALVIRGPDASRWAQAGWLHSGLAILLVGASAFGLAAMFDGAAALAGQPVGAVLGQLSLPALILAGTVAVLRAIRPLRRLTRYEATAAAKPVAGPHQPA